MTDIVRDIVPGGIGATGQLTVGTTSVQITHDLPDLYTGLEVRTDEDNEGVIYIGFGESVTSSTGYPLYAKEAQSLPLASVEHLWFIASQASQKLYWIAM